MRIAQVMLGRRFGGAERSFVDLSEALCARGHKVLAIVDPRGEALPILKASSLADNVVEQRCFGSWDRLAEHQIGRVLKAFNPLVVQAHLARAALLAGRAAMRLNLPAVAKTHNLVNLKYYQDITRLVPTTRAQETYLAERGVSRSAIRRIPNFSALGAVDTISLPTAQPYRLVSYGRMVHKKGFDVLLHALARVRARGLSVQLDLGGDGPEREVLAELIEHLRLSDCVRLCGWVHDVEAFLSGARAFILPSRDEPFGIAMLEAMARGVPVLATTTQGPREVLADACGLLVDSDDVDGLAAGIEAICDTARAEEVATNALQRYREKYSADAVVDQYEELYTELVSSSS